MKLIALTSAVLVLAMSVAAVPQPPSDDVVVAAPGIKGRTVADAQRPRHCQTCDRYIDKCVEQHRRRDRSECEKELCHEMPDMCQYCEDWGIDCSV